MPQFAYPTTSFIRDAPEYPWPFAIDGISRLWSDAFPQNLVLAEIFTDFSAVIMRIKSDSARRVLWEDAQFARIWVEPLVRRLIDCEQMFSSSEIGDVVDNSLTSLVAEECCRIGALLLLSKIRRRFDQSSGRRNPDRPARLIFTGYETDKLKNLVSDHPTSWTTVNPLCIWIATLAALETIGSHDGKWFQDLLRKTAQRAGLHQWHEVVVMASNLLWVKEILDDEVTLLGETMGMDDVVVADNS